MQAPTRKRAHRYSNEESKEEVPSWIAAPLVAGTFLWLLRDERRRSWSPLACTESITVAHGSCARPHRRSRLPGRIAVGPGPVPRAYALEAFRWAKISSCTAWCGCPSSAGSRKAWCEPTLKIHPPRQAYGRSSRIASSGLVHETGYDLPP